MNETTTPWRKSTYSFDGKENCVEVAPVQRGLAVRDSQDPEGPRLAFSSSDWDRFMSRVRQA
jgi:hypothetical protein